MSDGNRAQTALVTGANGFIGSHLVEELLGRGYRIRCLVREKSNLRWIEHLGVQVIRGSYDEDGCLRAAALGVDYVYHIAGAVKARRPAEFYLANTEATGRLAEAAIKAAPGLKRFVFSSSQAAVGPSPCLDKPKCELDECLPVSDYGKSKLLAEQELGKLADGLPFTIIRPPSVYGPRDTEIFMYFQWISRGLALLPGLRTRYAHTVYVKDLVRGMVLAAESERTAGKTYFLAEDRAYSWREISDTIAASLGKRPLKLPVPISMARFSALLSEAGAWAARKPTQFTRQKVAEMSKRYWTVSAEAARRDFGFACEYDLARGIGETAKWYRKNGWL
jgi:nucleoside-diphosphate-sugar epimerase